MRKFSFLFLLTALLVGNLGSAGAETMLEDDFENLAAFQNFKTVENMKLPALTDGVSRLRRSFARGQAPLVRNLRGLASGRIFV